MPPTHTAHSSQTDRATLFIAASEADSNLYYATHFIAPDPFIYFEVRGERLMIMSDLEVDRARHQATVDRVLSYSDLERRAKSLGVTEPGSVDIIHLVLQDADIKHVLVPSTFPFLHATRLQELGYQLQSKREPFYEQRMVKTAEEVRHVEASQRATETAVAVAHDALRRATIRDKRSIKLSAISIFASATYSHALAARFSALSYAVLQTATSSAPTLLSRMRALKTR